MTIATSYTCPNCGKPISSYDRLCPYCGHPLDEQLARYGHQDDALQPRDQRSTTTAKQNHRIPFNPPDNQQDPHQHLHHLSPGRQLFTSIVVIIIIGIIFWYVLNE